MTKIAYEVYDDHTGERIGTISGEQLRQYFGFTRHTPVFNGDIVKQFNERKSAGGEPERLRTILR